MPAITKRTDGRYQAAIQVAGTRRFVYGRARREVEHKLADLQRQARGGGLPHPGRRTVADLVSHYLATVGPTLKPRTQTDYRNLAERYVLPSIGCFQLSRISPDHIQALYGQLQAKGLARVPSQVHRLLHRMFRLAVLWRWLDENPADRVLPPTYRAPRQDVWDEAELARFLDGTRGDRHHPLWAFLIATGCRLGEALALRWDAVDLQRGVVTICASVQRIDGEWVETRPKTTAGLRVVTLPAEGMVALKRQRVQQAEWRLRAGPAWRDRDLVFSNPRGDYLAPEVVNQALTRACERLGLPRVTPHGLRHLHASLLLAAGVAVPMVSARLGHANPAITMAVYAHCLGHQDDEAAQIIGRAMEG